MNIKRAKEEIEHTVKAYLAKDALGEYAIPAIRQRPILLMGPPGIGKTQVMEQVANQVKALQTGWSERGISFEDSSARLISVVLHDRFSDTDNTLFIGHVGVLLPAEDGSLYFIEKVAFQEPYRLVKIQNRTELSDYLMEKYDTAWGQDTTRSFIMENDELMDGYRPNPLDSAS